MITSLLVFNTPRSPTRKTISESFVFCWYPIPNLSERICVHMITSLLVFKYCFFRITTTISSSFEFIRATISWFWKDLPPPTRYKNIATLKIEQNYTKRNFCIFSLHVSYLASSVVFLVSSQERKFSPKRKFWAGHPCGRPAQNFGQALQILEKQAFRNGHPTRTSMKKLRSEKLRADFSLPT